MGVLRDFFPKRTMIKEVCMNHRLLKVFIACFLGGCIGSIVALEIGKYFWWVGLLAGAAVGYLSYEFKEVLTAIPRAWKMAVAHLPTRRDAFQFLKLFFFSELLISTFLVPFVSFVLLMLSFSNEPLQKRLVFTGLLLYGSLGIALILNIFIWFRIGNFDSRAKELQSIAWRYNFITVFFWFIPIRLALLLSFFVTDLVPRMFWIFLKTLKVAPAFFWHLFKLIHSELRLLCAVDAALGVCAGFFMGSAILGGLAGGLWGVVNFEILSKRVLKLVPLKVRIS